MKKNKFKTVIAWIVVVIIAFIAIISFLVFGFNNSKSSNLKTFTQLDLQSQTWNNSSALLNSYNQSLNNIESAYESNFQNQLSNNYAKADIWDWNTNLFSTLSLNSNGLLINTNPNSTFLNQMQYDMSQWITLYNNESSNSYSNSANYLLNCYLELWSLNSALVNLCFIGLNLELLNLYQYNLQNESNNITHWINLDLPTPEANTNYISLLQKNNYSIIQDHDFHHDLKVMYLMNLSNNLTDNQKSQLTVLNANLFFYLDYYLAYQNFGNNSNSNCCVGGTNWNSWSWNDYIYSFNDCQISDTDFATNELAQNTNNNLGISNYKISANIINTSSNQNQSLSETYWFFCNQKVENPIYISNTQNYDALTTLQVYEFTNFLITNLSFKTFNYVLWIKKITS